MTMTISTEQRSPVFSLATPYLTQGITTQFLAQTDELTVVIKVYASGGENRMHHHSGEDHSFVVLEGEATFRIGSEENVQVLRRYQGALIERDVDYRFENSGDVNLVMLRIWSGFKGGKATVFYPDGAEKSDATEPSAG